MEQLDQLVVSIQLEAKSKCCQSRTKFDWSDDIHDHTIILNSYWYISRKTVTKKKDVSEVLQQIYDDLLPEYRQYIDIDTGLPNRNWFNTKTKLRYLMAQLKKMLHQRLHKSFENEADCTGSTADKVKLKKEQIKTDKKLNTTMRRHFHPCRRSDISHLLLPDKDVAGNKTNNLDSAITWKSETYP